MKKLLILFVFVFSFFLNSNAQLYMTAGGLRMGTDWGFTIQQRIFDKVSGEFIFQNSLSREEALMTFLYEQHYSLVTKGLNVYSGGGIHFGWNSEPAEKMIDNPFGITAILGAEFTIARFNLSYDFKPALNLSGGEKTFYAQSGISVRYIVLKNKVYKDIQKKKKKKKKEEAKQQRREERGKEWWEVWKKKKNG